MDASLNLDDPVLAPQAQREAAAVIAALDARARRAHTPSGKGRMSWRCWGAGPVVVLVHGGGGAWTHWTRNIEPLAQTHTVWVPDLPGLGESALPATLSIEGIARTVEAGLRELIPGEAPIDLVGFSFGAPVAAGIAAGLQGRVRHLILASTRFIVDPELIYPPLVNWKACEDPHERMAAHRRNLERVMIANPHQVDALAVQIHATNIPRSRFFGPKLHPNDNLHRFLPHVRARGSITGVSGAADQFARAYLHRQDAALKAIHPQARFHLLAGAGHWVQYEAAEAFNALLLDTLAGNLAPVS